MRWGSLSTTWFVGDDHWGVDHHAQLTSHVASHTRLMPPIAAVVADYARLAMPIEVDPSVVVRSATSACSAAWVGTRLVIAVRNDAPADDASHARLSVMHCDFRSRSAWQSTWFDVDCWLGDVHVCSAPRVEPDLDVFCLWSSASQEVYAAAVSDGCRHTSSWLAARVAPTRSDPVPILDVCSQTNGECMLVATRSEVQVYGRPMFGAWPLVLKQVVACCTDTRSYTDTRFGARSCDAASAFLTRFNRCVVTGVLDITQELWCDDTGAWSVVASFPGHCATRMRSGDTFVCDRTDRPTTVSLGGSEVVRQGTLMLGSGAISVYGGRACLVVNGAGHVVVIFDRDGDIAVRPDVRIPIHGCTPGSAVTMCASTDGSRVAIVSHTGYVSVLRTEPDDPADTATSSIRPSATTPSDAWASACAWTHRAVASVARALRAVYSQPTGF